jgi:hypothetical protein
MGVTAKGAKDRREDMAIADFPIQAWRNFAPSVVNKIRTGGKKGIDRQGRKDAQ